MVKQIRGSLPVLIKLCLVPWGTMTKSPALTIFSSPATTALH
jgi:hypothetical protein